jgi:hypothetical protein
MSDRPPTSTKPMRPNPVRVKLDAGGTVYGTMAFEFFTPGLMAALEAVGADFGSVSVLV